SLDRVFSQSYVPTNQDILRCRMKTTGIVETIFYLDNERNLHELHKYYISGAGDNLEDVDIDRLREIEEISMAESPIVESPTLAKSLTMVESPIIVESPTMVESPLIVERPTLVESSMVESSMEKKNITGENSILRDTLRKPRLECDRERKWQKRAKDKLYKIEKGLEEFEANLTDDSNRDYQLEIDIDMNEPDIPLPLPSTILKEYDKVLLRQFRNKIDKLKHSECPTCKECFLSITLVVGECRRCYTEKTLPKKFLFDNNMNPGEVPKKLQKLTEIEEMLIAQVFPVIVIYRLRGRQHGYRENIINFPQDVKEFTTRLP
ncbi:22995_t:CDS:2, partial [Gigaspora rosea]